MESFASDLKLAVRTLRKSPVFSLAAIATLALGLGANTAVFQLVEAVFFRTVPVPRPDQLAIIQIRGGNLGFGVVENLGSLTKPLFEAIRDHQQAFAGVAAWSRDSIPVGTAPSLRRMSIVYASGGYFSTLQLRPAAGRLFDPSDDLRGCSQPGVVLSFAFWMSEFGGQSSAIGQRLIVRDRPLEIIGVAPPGFTGLDVGDRFDLMVPLCATSYLFNGDEQWSRADYFWLSVMGRLKPGWSRDRASAQLGSMSPAILSATAPSGYNPQTTARYKQAVLEAIPGANGLSALRREYRRSLYLLLGMTGLVLLIACANLGNLMLARASSRRRELAVRVALGASSYRLARQALAEAAVLTATGGAIGFLLASTLSRGMIALLQTSDDTIQLALAPSWPMFVFAVCIAAGVCLLSGCVPALRAIGCDPGEALKSAGRGVTVRRFSAQRTLAAIQISISLILVTGALFLVGTFRRLITLDPGFRVHGILIASFNLSKQHLSHSQAKRAAQSIVDEIRDTAQVESAAATTNVAIDGGSWTLGLTGSLSGWSKFTWVTPGYFPTVGTPLISGRDFTAADSENAPAVAIVNNAFVRRYFAGANPVGKTFRTAREPGYPETEFQIVGVCKDTRYSNLRDEPPPQTFAPIAQHPSYDPWVSVYVRSSAPLNILSAAIERRIARSHPGVEIGMRVFETTILDSLRREKLLAVLSGFFAVLASGLAATGLYGVIAYISASRRNEVSIRLALGATRAGIVRLLMLDAAVPLAIGVSIGLAGSLAFARAASSLIFGFSPYHPLTYCIAASVLAGVAALGSYLPARRASRSDSLTVLNYE